MSVEFCRDRTYQTRHLRHLPFEYSLGQNEVKLRVDYTKTNQLELLRKIIDDSALRGDNVGIDEYQDGDKNIDYLFNLSEIFQASDSLTGHIEAFLVVQPCIYLRSYDPCTASLYVFRSASISNAVYADLMSLAADFARMVDIGYTQCFTQMALCLHDLHRELRRQGFLTIAVLPDWVEIAGVGFGDNAVMCKQLGVPDREVKSSRDVLDLMTSKLYPPEDVAVQYQNAELKTVPGLPRTIVSPGKGNLILRNARKEEDEILYEMLVDASEKGAGYSVHETPSMDVFRMDMMLEGHPIVAEEERTKKIFGLFFIHSARLRRSLKRKICETTILIREEMRGKGYASLIAGPFQSMSESLGFVAEVRDTFLNNSAALAVWRNTNVKLCGVFPRGAYQTGIGWVDLAVAFFSFTEDSRYVSTSKKRPSNL